MRHEYFSIFNEFKYFGFHLINHMPIFFNFFFNKIIKKVTVEWMEISYHTSKIWFGYFFGWFGVYLCSIFFLFARTHILHILPQSNTHITLFNISDSGYILSANIVNIEDTDFFNCSLPWAFIFILGAPKVLVFFSILVLERKRSCWNSPYFVFH